MSDTLASIENLDDRQLADWSMCRVSGAISDSGQLAPVTLDGQSSRQQGNDPADGGWLPSQRDYPQGNPGSDAPAQ